MPTAPTETLRAHRYHHGDLRRTMVRAAVRLIEAKGPSGFTLREVAQIVGVTHPAVYRHFPSRATLVAEVAEQGFRSLTRHIDRSVGTPRSPLARLQEVGVAYVRFAVAHPGHFRVMFGDDAREAGGETLQQARDEAFGRVVAEIAACQARGLLRTGPPQALGLSAWVMVHGLAMLLLDRSPRLLRLGLRADELARQVTEALMEGLMPSRVERASAVHARRDRESRR